ncbi:polyketide synthase [Podospora appendiculata]|uniref:Polyketide synthase n=1 Tax=Podospora appendiculata TaxID=314037 RepID=A0AAE0WZA2_9PEZI|nr:polyketide synthase [Podospora appendiculata]
MNQSVQVSLHGELANKPVSVSTASSTISGQDSPPALDESISSSGTSVTSDAPDIPGENSSVIVGLAFRFPGARNVSQLWEALEQKKDLQKKMPRDRFNVDAFHHPLGANKGTTNAKYGYFLDQGLDEFDNEFFRISAKEAESMDPQQRLLLEVVYEALENAGITLADIKGTNTSVYAGSFSNDYNAMVSKDSQMYPKYAVTGSGNSIISNRISYFFDLQGPSMTVDTACSSSLVCFHFGNKSLQHKEADIAIIAGSALHFDPTIFTTMTDLGMLSSDGRCRTFDSSGSGYVRGEGVAAVILKRKVDAEAAGDNIMAVVRGSGSNHDGSKSGLTVPNGAAQARLIRQTYAEAGLELGDTDYFESHGTGTKVGDPIEANAIGSVFASTRTAPIYVGSIKSNLGHLEGASGLAGVIKAAMQVQAGKILPNMHFQNPNPEINFSLLNIVVPTSVVDWKSATGLRRASVNSFGYGGANAHVIIENYRPRTQIEDRAWDTATKADAVVTPTIAEGKQNRPYLIPLTSHHEKAAKNLISQISDYVVQKGHEGTMVEDLACSYSVRRSMHQRRSFVVATTLDSLTTGIEGVSKTEEWARQDGPQPRIGFVFTGQGAQWYAMGELLKTSDTTRVAESLISQPVCAAIQLAIVDLLRAWGVTPSAVVGHSSGEIAAAYAAGILSFENAIICAYYRGLYMSQGASQDKKGAMIAVGLTEEEAKSELAGYTGRIALAAVNSPSSLTLSGDEDALLELKESLDQRKVFARRLLVEQAFHSHHMNPLAPAFEQALNSTPTFKPTNAAIKFSSSVTARDSSARKLDASYWAANMTGVVRFADALVNLVLDEQDNQAVDVLLEIGAHPALRGPAKEITKDLKLEIPYFGTLDRSKPAFEALLSTAGHLFTLGYPVDLAAVNSDLSLTASREILRVTKGKQRPDLPSYAWNHGKYWAGTRLIREHQQRASRHTLLGAPMPGMPHNHPRFRSFLNLAEVPWLAGHVVDGKTVLPGAAYVSMALEAVSTTLEKGTSVKEYQMRDVMFKAALTLSADSESGVEVLLDLQPLATSAKSVSGSWYRFSVFSYDGTDRMLEHCHGLVSAKTGVPQTLASLATKDTSRELRSRANRRTTSDVYYSRLGRLGLDYGDNFRLLEGQVESGDGFSIASLVFDPAKVVSIPADECIVHPTLLDAAFHVIFAAIETCAGGMQETFVPTFIRTATFSGVIDQLKNSTTIQKLCVRSETKLPGKRVAINHLSIEDETSGNSLIDLDGLELTALGNDSAGDEARRDLFYHTRWLSAFSQLGTASPAPDISGLGQLLDVYVHQFPNADILHFTSREETVREALKHLGGVGMERRRFRSITPKSTLSVSDEWKNLTNDWSGLVNTADPIETGYDLVILSEAPLEDVTKYLKPGGYIITDNVDLEDTSSLKEVFSQSDFKVLQFSSEVAHVEQRLPLTILLSEHPSTLSQDVASRIKQVYPGGVSTASFPNDTVSTADVLSLVSLDNDLFFFQDQEAEAASFRALQKLFNGDVSNITWLLRGASVDTTNPSQALIAGLLRTMRSEVTDSHVITLDLEATSQDPVYIASRVVEVLTSSISTEDEISERKGSILIPRIQTDDARNVKLPVPGNRQPRYEPLHGSRNLALKIGKTGLLDTLSFEDDDDTASPHLLPGQVEIEVKASALNFRDLAASLGIIDDYRLGDEASGIVVRTGSDVSSDQFKAGDRVLVCCPGQGAHRTHIRAPACMFTKIGDMDFVTAASFEAILCTALYSLDEIARLKPGEYCLIHSAAGGVGQMAIQVAQMLGANVIATVGSPEKRAFLIEQFGLKDEMIFSSRDLSFVDGVMAVTNGRGCDVALNSLAGDLLHATWKCIARFGRLIEIGKRDIHENTKLDMEPFRKQIMYASVDLITVYLHNNPRFVKLQNDCYALIRDGKIRPPGPIKTFRYSETVKAFRLMQMGKFFGKIVLVPEQDELVPVMPPAFRNVPIFSPEKSYLLVGGLGGIGRSLAEWMFRRGVREIAFLSRSGAGNADARDTISWLESKGVKVSVFKGDVAVKTVVDDCVNALRHNLGGIFQAVMVLQDTAFANMTVEQWRAAVYPKLHGTYYLHKATENLDLDFFVSFSSAASVVGSMGQANYVAANTYMDALMRHRRERGLAGTSMSVGVVDDVGVVAEDSTLSSILDRLGYDTITRDEVLYQVEEAVISSKGAYARGDGIDYHHITTGINNRRKDLYWAQRPLFRNLYENLDLSVDGGGGKSTKNLSALLKNAADIDKRADVLTEAFIEKVAQVLGTPAESIHAKNTLSAYGLDSIVAVELRKWFFQTTNVDMPLFDILGAPSILALTRKAAENMRLGVAAAEEEVESSAVNQGVLADKLKAGGASSISIFDSITKPDNVPLSSYQSRMWFLHNFSTDPSSFNFVVSSRLEGEPRQEILQQALDELIRRNGSLRTRYFEGEEYAQQELIDESNAPIRYEDLSASSDPETALSSLINVEKRHVIDITEGESLRVVLAKLAEGSYCLTFVFHHISCDSGSSESFVSQFVKLYEAFSEGKDVSRIPVPRVSYADFSVWQSQLAQSPEVRNNIDWWQRTLDGAPTASSLLPFAKSNRLPGSRQRNTVTGAVPLSGLGRLKRISARMNTTPFNFVTAAFRAFHYRYTEDNDLTMLMIDGNRPHPELQDTIGFFVNMVPLRFHGNDLDSATFEQLVQDVKSVTHDALEHSSAPFEDVVQILGLDRSATHFPVGQIAVNYQMYGQQSRIRSADFTLAASSVEDLPTPCDLALEITENPAEGLEFKLQFDSGLYGDADMERFIENFTTFLSSAIRDHRQPVQEINMSGEMELAHLRKDLWNIAVHPDPWGGKTVVDMILEVASSRPSDVAVLTSDDETITYQALIVRGKQIAAQLQSSPYYRAGDVVGVFFNPDIDMISSLVGIVLAGGGYAALDPSFATERLRYMIGDSSIKILLASLHLAAEAKQLVGGEIKADILVVPQSTPDLAVAWTAPDIVPNTPFYTIYTSGSTGKPKAVPHTHRTTQAMLSTHNTYHQISSADKILSQSSIAFDLSVAQIWGALTSGARLLLAKSNIRKDPSALASFMRRGEVTVTYFPATQFASVIEHNSDDVKACASYRRSIFAGETLPVRLVRAIYDLGTAVKVYNQYGPSETSVQSSSALVPIPGPEVLTIPVGSPLPNSSHYIVDPAGHPVPATVVGEVYIGGAQVSTGYLNLAQTTLEAFVDDTFASDAFLVRGWSKMYKSGDKARFLADGQLDFKGRIKGDRQIKIRGYRLNLAEIDNELYAASVHLDESYRLVNVAVVPREVGKSEEHLTDDRQLIAFIQSAKSDITPQQKQDLVNSLHAIVKPHLNDYMMPSGYQFLDSLSGIVSGKIGLKHLLTVELDLLFPSSKASPVEAARSPAAEFQDILGSVVQSFKVVLKLSRGREVAPDESFFELGGHSMLVLRLSAAIKREFGIKLAVKDLFANPTPSGIAQLIATAKGIAIDDATATIDEEIDWRTEGTLPDEPAFHPTSSATTTLPRSEIKEILLTGVDSPVGSRMLNKILLTRPDVTVSVIGSRKPLVLEDIKGIINQETDGTAWRRVNILPGSLSLPSFGLTPTAFDALAKRIHLIYHFGGYVSLLKRYADLRPANVQATLDLIRLAAASPTHKTEIHYLSTWSVSHLQSWPSTNRTRSDIITSEQSSSHFVPGSGSQAGAYFKARWVAESLLDQAASRGIVTTITRASALADLEAIQGKPAGTEELSEVNFFLGLLGAILRTGMVPNLQDVNGGVDVDCVTAEHVAAVVERLTLSHDDTAAPEGRIFHVRNPKPLRLAELPGVMANNGEVLKMVELETWLEAVANSGDGSNEVFSAVLKEYISVGHRMFSLDDSETREQLRRVGEVRDDELLLVDGGLLMQIKQRA